MICVGKFQSQRHEKHHVKGRNWMAQEAKMATARKASKKRLPPPS